MTKIKELIEDFKLNQEILGREKKYVDLCMFRLYRWERFTVKQLGVAEAEEVNQLHIKKYIQERQHVGREVLFEAIVELERKQVILLESDDPKTKLITVTFIKVKGFEQIPIYVFDAATKPEEFMIMSYLLKVKRPTSYAGLASIINKSERTAKTLINSMYERGLIDIERGKYYTTLEGVRKEKNKYSVAAEEAIGGKPLKSHSPQVLEGEETRGHNWYKKGLLTEDDFYILFTTKDEKLMQKAEVRIKRTEAKGMNFSKMRNAAVRRIENEKRRLQQDQIDELLRTHGAALKLSNGEFIGINAEYDLDNVIDIHYVGMKLGEPKEISISIGRLTVDQKSEVLQLIGDVSAEEVEHRINSFLSKDDDVACNEPELRTTKEHMDYDISRFV